MSEMGDGVGRGGPGVDVLVVDDDPGIRSSAADILRQDGFTVAEAEDGQAAREFLSGAVVRVLVLDVRMPRLDGFALIDGLENPPPVVLTPASAYDDEVRQRGAKIAAYIRKPVEPRRLVEAVSQALAGAGGTPR